MSETKAQRQAVTVRLYTQPYCPHCLRAKALLVRRGVAFTEIDAAKGTSIRETIIKRTGKTTVPLIFSNEQFVGGADELFRLDRLGSLMLSLEIEAMKKSLQITAHEGEDA